MTLDELVLAIRRRLEHERDADRGGESAPAMTRCCFCGDVCDAKDYQTIALVSHLYIDGPWPPAAGTQSAVEPMNEASVCDPCARVVDAVVSMLAERSRRVPYGTVRGDGELGPGQGE